MGRWDWAKLNTREEVGVRGEEVWVSKGLPGGESCGIQTSTSKQNLKCWGTWKAYSGFYPGVLMGPIKWSRKTEDTLVTSPLKTPGWQDLLCNIFWITKISFFWPSTPTFIQRLCFIKIPKCFENHPPSERKTKWFKILKLPIKSIEHSLHKRTWSSYIFIFLFFDE